MVMRTKPKMTVKDYMALPQEHGVELIEGEFVMSPTPEIRHQRLVFNLCAASKAYVDRTRRGEFIVSPMDVILSEEIVLQPDLLFVSPERSHIVRDRVFGAPDLVIEILSPSTTDRDRFVKRGIYARFGVREYWIIDGAARTVEVLTLKDGRFELLGIFEENDRLSTPVLPDLDLDLTAIWA
jgi:Uma2 family endonuclease